jgi:Flp pilus assembly protein TadB
MDHRLKGWGARKNSVNDKDSIEASHGKEDERMMLIYLGVALVIGGAATVLVSSHGNGPVAVEPLGKIVALCGFVIYVVGRIRYRRMKKASPQPDAPGHHDTA